MKDKTAVFNNLINDINFQEILSNASANHIDHPIIYLLKDENEYIDSSGSRMKTVQNTKTAILSLQNNYLGWLQKTEKKFLEKDYANISAALGEIRCFGYLIETFGAQNVKNIHEESRPTPDFEITIGKQTINVEVNTVQMNQRERDALEQFRDLNNRSHGPVSISEHIIHPFGSKIGVTTTQSVILKLISIKEKNNQLSDKVPSILWIDLQDEYMNSLADRIDKAGPYFSGKGHGSGEGIFSNELWYSLYSEKDDPIFEGGSLNPDEGNEFVVGKCVHCGKFMEPKYKNVSAVIFCGPGGVVLFENTKAKKKLPRCFFEKIVSGRWFKIESCRMNYPGKFLKRSIRLDKKCLKAMGKKKFFTF